MVIRVLRIPNISAKIFFHLSKDRLVFSDGGIIVKVIDSSSSEIGTTMKNNNKFANILQSNVNSSSRQVKSLTSITATKTHTAHSTLTYGRNSSNYNLRQFEQHDN